MFNIKKKVVKYLSNANDSVVEFLYFQKNNAFVCELCETVSITKHFLDSLLLSTSFTTLNQQKPFPPFQITNGIVLELFKFKELCKYSWV